ncbi:MAG: peptide-methionine (S)-S-oxide reductase MsrA [Sphaerochaetaceae bacterium]|jgi:peptide methionine sulfoxide reductase msrA/msrB
MTKYTYILVIILVMLFVSPLLAKGVQEDLQDAGTITTVPNSISKYEHYPVAIFAGGCFWGVEYFFDQQEGVVDAVSGYTGGSMEFPTYMYVSTGMTGHVESVAVFYDPNVTDYETLARLFFEIHDPTQVGGQGPDIGSMYESVIFYGNTKEKEIASSLIGKLKDLGYDVVTRVEPRTFFYKAEGYHQNYYAKGDDIPYCHVYTPRFVD